MIVGPAPERPAEPALGLRDRDVEALKEVHYKSTKIVIEASQGITIRGPGGFVTIDGGGVSIVGTMVKINSGGSALSGTAAAPQEPDEAKPIAPNKPKPADSGGV